MIVALIVSAVLGGIFAIAYYMNSKTPVPDGCESLQTACEGCTMASCHRHPTHQMEV